MSSEILVVPAFGQGHLFPAMELCKLLVLRNYKSTLVIFPHLSPSVPSSFRQHPLIDVVDVPSPPPAEQGSDFHSQRQSSVHQMLLTLEALLEARPNKPICAVVDALIIIGSTADVFHQFRVPTVGFFTSGACSAALEYAAWKAQPGDIKPGEIRLLPGLPDDMGLTISDLKRRPHGPPRGGGGGGPIGRGKKRMGLPGPGEQPSWVEDAEKSIALIINTCDDLERPFITYLADQIRRPVWGMGPLVSEQYWKSSGSLVSDREIGSNKPSSVTEDEVIQWLNSKPRGSVLYVAFGSSVIPTAEEHAQLAEALGESTWPFIWVIQPGSGKTGNSRAIFGSKSGSDPKEQEDEDMYFSNDLDSRVGVRGLIIRGWAPQLLILSHASTGGFLSHCGWNSTMEAIGLGVPLLAWPLRGDQYYDAKLAVGHMKVGYMVADDMSETVRKDEIVKGIDRLMRDEEVKRRASELKAKFVDGFPKGSVASLDAFCDFVKRAA